MPQTLLEVYQKAEMDLAQNRLEDALNGFCTVVQQDPRHLWTRYKIGIALEKLNQPNRAFEVFNAIGQYCLKAGFPLLGLSAIKRAERLQAGIEESLDIMVELYSLESDRIQPSLSLFAIPKLQGDLISTESVSMDHEKLLRLAEQLAKTFSEAKFPKHLPPAPLLSFLTTEAMIPILDLLVLNHYRQGEVIVAEGDPGESIFLLAHGEVEVKSGVNGDAKTLARLESGSVFGEMALLSNAPRIVSVTALRECELFEIQLSELEEAAEELNDITWALAKFTRQRFLNNLMLTSPVFAPFSPEERRELLDRFTSVGIPTDEVVIREGSEGNGLYLILGGEVEVSKFEGDSRVHLATLKEGSVFGEISLVCDVPTTATVTATRGGEFLFLPRDDFRDLIQERPDIKQDLEIISEQRLREQKQAMQDSKIISEDGLILF